MLEKTRSIRIVLTASLVALCAFAALSAPAAAEEMETLRFEANVMTGTGQGAGHRSTMLEMRINAWTTEEERQMVLGEIKEASSQSTRNRNRAVARALRGSSRVGSMNLRARHSWPIRYSRMTEMPDGGKRILLATDRPVTFVEAFGNTMAGDFDVTVVELIFDAEGNGRGALSLGTEVRWNPEKEALEVTNLTSQPVKLGNVRQVGG